MPDDGRVLLTRPVLDAIVAGDVDLVFRLWKRPTVKAGGRLRTAVGELAVHEVDVVDPATITDDEVRAWVAETLAAFKVPTYVERRHEKLPRNASGKLLKNVLRGEGHVSFAETM